MEIKVFIECGAGSDQKNVFDEITLEHKKSFAVSRKYPYPYGFIQGTKSGDGDCLDCFILTNKDLRVGSIVDVVVVGMMEQFETRDENKKEDHNILAVIKGEEKGINEEVKEVLTEFISHVWDDRVGKVVEVGKFYGESEAIKLINELAVGQKGH